MGSSRRFWTAEQLLRQMPALSLEQDDSVDPLGIEDWFYESSISDVRLCATERVAGMLIDLRTAECFAEENIAVLVMYGPTRLQWSMPPAHSGRGVEEPRWRWPMSLSSSFVCDGAYVTARIGGRSDGDDLVITAERAHLYAGTISGLGEIPDLGVDDDEIRRRLPQWSHELDVIGSWQLSGTPSRPPKSGPRSLRVVGDT